MKDFYSFVLTFCKDAFIAGLILIGIGVVIALAIALWIHYDNKH